MFLNLALEARHRLLKEGQLACARKMEDGIELASLLERDAEVARVDLWVAIIVVGEVAHHLIAEEIQGDAVRIAARELTAELRHVEVEGGIEIAAGNGKVKDILGIAHDWGSPFSLSLALCAHCSTASKASS